MDQVNAMAREIPGLAPAVPHERRRSGNLPVLLLLDARGFVRYCSDADALQRLPVDLVGRPVDELIVGLPLRHQTPGYNVAYVRFAFRDAATRPMALKLPSGGTRPVMVGVEPLWMDRGYCLLVKMRFICEAAGILECHSGRPWGVRASAMRGEPEVSAS